LHAILLNSASHYRYQVRALLVRLIYQNPRFGFLQHRLHIQTPQWY